MNYIYLFLIILKKLSHLENNEVVIIRDRAVQIVLCTTSSMGPAKDEDLK